ncbi:MAG: sigma-70 family RNA polymerase sigma factor [Polyangiaceae bacterium]|jgi:RNA polymerase sigma-70 factor (ECF subfamily)
MTIRELRPAVLPVDTPPGEASSSGRSDAKGYSASPVRLREIIDKHYDFVWRTLRHLGVENASAEDAAQQVVCILARRLGEIAPGAEMSFLFSTAVRVASEARRAARRRPVSDASDVDALPTPLPSPEELVDERCAREVLRNVLEAIPLDLRIIFVLFEIEELTVAQAAALVGIPVGTAASRLRRARETFHAIVRRMQAAQRGGVRGGGP